MQLVYFLISNLIIFHSIIKETRKLNIYIIIYLLIVLLSFFFFWSHGGFGLWRCEWDKGHILHLGTRQYRPYDLFFQPNQMKFQNHIYIYIYGSTQRYVHLLSEPSHETPCRPTMWFHLCWLQGINIWIILKSNHLNWPRILEHLYGRWYVYTRSNSG